jgi:S-DNA-T family DNA segregation ATPase FtsK/SpoIIIE
MTAPFTIPPAVPVFPFSIFDPAYVGVDEFGELVHLELAEKNVLVGGEPGGGKSVALNLLVAHGALSADCRLVLIDGKQVELGAWRGCADVFVGPSIDDAITAFRALQKRMNERYEMLLDLGQRKITRDSGQDAWLIVIDEYAYFSATVGDKKQQGEFAALSRDLVARGRAAAMPVVLATQRPSHQVIDPSLRDLFAYRWAFRCTTDSSSDTVLGHGWAGQGYTAAAIDPKARGVSWLLAETGIPRRVKTAFLTDDQIRYLAALAAQLRRKGGSGDQLRAA